MQKCPKCGCNIDDEMFVCPSCGEELQTVVAKNKFEYVSIHFVRWLQFLALVFPLIGFVIAYALKKKDALIAKTVVKFSVVGISLWLMLALLAFICYFAMTLSGISPF